MVELKSSTISFQNQNDVFVSLLFPACNGWNYYDPGAILPLVSWNFSISTSASTSNCFLLWNFSDGFPKPGIDFFDCAIAKSHKLGSLNRISSYLFHIEVLFCNEVEEFSLLLFRKPSAGCLFLMSWGEFCLNTGEASTLPKLCLCLRGLNVWNHFHCMGLIYILKG